MAIPEPPPDLGLWPAVRAAIGGWVESDEDAVRALGDQWTNAANAFADVLNGGRGAPFSIHDPSTWHDPAGEIWMRQIMTIGEDLKAREAELRALGAHAHAFAEDVIHAKQEITRVIVQNLETYDKLVMMPGGADVAAQQTFVAEIARAINAFLDALAAQIAGREVGVAAAERPTASADEDALDGFGFEEFFDLSSSVSAFASAGAVLYPPAATLLGPLALISGTIALVGHSAEYFQEPTYANGVTVAADALGVVPGVRALGEGVSALGRGADEIEAYWKQVASMVNGGDGLATVLQASSQMVPAAPTAYDVFAPGEQSDIATYGSATYGGWRVLELIGSLR